MLDRIASEGIAKVYAEDWVSQEHYITTILKEVRGVNVNRIKELGAFFVPNDLYMVKYFGMDIAKPEYDCYSYDGLCYWSNYLVFPIRNVKNVIVGFVGYNPFIALENKEKGIWDRPYYRHSNKSLMNKSLFLFAPPNYYQRALKEGYIILTDGVFDMISCFDNGLNAGALLGSYVSNELAAMLTFIPRVFIAMDNDNAGLMAYRRLKQLVPQTQPIKQGKFKDIDDLLKSEYRDEVVKTLKESLGSSKDIYLRF